MDKSQEKFLELFKIMGDCRQKLYATYNLFVSNLEKCKESKVNINNLYEMLLDCSDKLIQTFSGKPSKGLIKQTLDSSDKLKEECGEELAFVETCMEDSDTCCTAYIKEVGMCRDAYRTLKHNSVEAGTMKKSISKGYMQQITLIKRVLDKIKGVKADYSIIKQEIFENEKLFNELYNSIHKKFSLASKVAL